MKYLNLKNSKGGVDKPTLTIATLGDHKNGKTTLNKAILTYAANSNPGNHYPKNINNFFNNTKEEKERNITIHCKYFQLKV